MCIVDGKQKIMKTSMRLPSHLSKARSTLRKVFQKSTLVLHLLKKIDSEKVQKQEVDLSTFVNNVVCWHQRLPK